MFRLKQYLLILVAALSLVFMPVAANAQVQLYCDGSGGVGGGQFYYADSVNSQGACAYQGVQHVFSQIICNFVLILDSVLGKVYCGIQYAITPILAALLTLYVVVFGAQILMGTAQLNSKEIVIRLLKIAGVWTLVTQSTWGIGMAFQFFAGAMNDGSRWVLNAVCTIPSLATSGMCPNVSGGNVMSVYQYIDGIIYAAILGPFTTANDKVIGFFLVLMGIFPPIFAMAISWLVTTLTMLARTLISFLLCLSAIAFLIALSPIFISFMLFQSTNHLFEDWLKYLVAYSLQMTIVFAIIALWIIAMSLFGGFFNTLSNVIFPYQDLRVGEGGVMNPVNSWGICRYITSYSPPGNPASACVVGLPCMPSLRCNPAFNPLSPIPAIRNAAIIAPDQLLTAQDFLYFMSYNLFALIMIAYMFNVLLKNAPDIARQLSGPAAMPSLAGGFGMGGFGQATGMGQSVGQQSSPQTPPAASGNATRSFIETIGGMLGFRNPVG